MQDLSYDVPNSANKKETLHLLQSVTGFIAPGEMTALVTALTLPQRRSCGDPQHSELSLCPCADGTKWLWEDHAIR